MSSPPASSQKPHEMGMEKVLHIGGEKKTKTQPKPNQNPLIKKKIKISNKLKIHRHLHKAIVVNCHF